MIQIAEARPPYVTFEVRAEEDRIASLEAGHYVARDVHYALITPAGSKDRIERKVDEWFDKLKGDVHEGRFPAEWLEHYKKAYEAFKEGQELPPEGLAIEQWPPASPAQIKTLRAMGIRTVEDLSVANEEAMNRLGMGARALKQRAVDWLAASAGSGKDSGLLEKLREENAALKSRVESLETQLKAAVKPQTAAKL